MTKVLVVDDSSVIRTMILNALSLNGYTVAIASNPSNALTLINSSPTFDIVISDLNMPEMDGIELIKLIKMNNSYRFVPTILLTSDDSSETRNRAKAAKISKVLHKPITEQVLLKFIKVIA